MNFWITNTTCIIYFRLGTKWEEGVFSEQKLEQASTLLPLEEQVLPVEDEKCFKKKINKNSEPNSKVDSSKLESLDYQCSCLNSTKFSSLTVEDLESVNCKCHSKSIKESNLDVKVVKERHISIDSARDSGIGENSNFADKYDDTSDEDGVEKSNTFHLNLPASSSSNCLRESQTERYSDLRGYWQPKLKRSLAERLPNNSFHLIPPSRYIFPGAEVFYDPDEKLHYEVDSSSSDSSDIESDVECNNASV